MAVLSDENRTVARTDITQQIMAASETVGITKTELAAAVAAADQWAEDNSASFNSALPQPARSTLTAKQKARVLMFVLKRRYEVA